MSLWFYILGCKPLVLTSRTGSLLPWPGWLYAPLWCPSPSRDFFQHAIHCAASTGSFIKSTIQFESFIFNSIIWLSVLHVWPCRNELKQLCGSGGNCTILMRNSHNEVIYKHERKLMYYQYITLNCTSCSTACVCVCVSVCASVRKEERKKEWA